MDAYIAMNNFAGGGSSDDVLTLLKVRDSEAPVAGSSRICCRQNRGFVPRTAFDVGANTGESAKLLLALWGGGSKSFDLHSFEPVPREFTVFVFEAHLHRALVPTATFDKLRKTVVERNNAPVPRRSSEDHGHPVYETSFYSTSITLHHAAVSDHDGRMEMYDGLDNIKNREKRSAWATLAKKGTSYGEVAITTVDSLLDRGVPAPELIKIDTEGWDYMVLEGMQQTLAKHVVQVIVLEFSHDTWPRSQNPKATLKNTQELLHR